MPNQVVRKIKPKAKGYRGKEPFLKTGGEMIPWESFLERDYVRLADFDFDIEKIISQPECIKFLHSGKRRKYFPDYKVINKAHRVFIVEVKPSVKAKLEENLIKYAAARLFCEDMGWTFIVLTENDIRPGYLQENLAMLRALGTHEIDESILDKLVDKLSSVGECTMEDFRFYFSELTEEDFYGSLYQLIYFQEVYADLIQEPLSELSLIRRLR